jgi:hypothetical protein
MLKIDGHEVWRGGDKVGYVEGDRIRNHDGRMLGYFSDNHIYNADGHKIAYVEGNHLYSEGRSNAGVHLDDINKNIVGGILPEMCKCAIYCLIGA